MKLAPLQWLAIQYLEASLKMQVLFGGAAGPGKTTLGCIWQIERRLKNPGSVGGLARKTLIDLKKTTLLTFKRTYKKYYEKKYGKLKYNNQTNTIEFPNGSMMFLIDLAFAPSDPDYHRFGGYELTDIFLDECGECDQRGVDILFSRIRYMIPDITVSNGYGGTMTATGIPKMLMCSNPSVNWLKTEWVEDDSGTEVKLPDHRVYIRATLNDNPDKEFVKTYMMSLSTLPEYDQLRLIHGSWSYIFNNAPFYTEFNHDKHVRDCIIDEDYPLHFSFDYNMEPMSCTISQKTDYGINILAEYQNNGSTEDLCQIIVGDGWLEYDTPVLVTGDRSGENRSTTAPRDYDTDYKVICREFNISKSQLLDTRSANKSHEFSRRLCNMIFKHVTVNIHPSCKVLIQELKKAKVDINGKIIKDRKVYKLDLFDANRYQFNAWFNKKGITSVMEYSIFLKNAA